MQWLRRSQQAYQPTIGMILFLLFVFLVTTGALGWSWFEFIWLNQAGVVTEGEVIAREQTPKGVRSITYRFETTDNGGTGVVRERGRRVSSSIANQYREGETLPIIYLPNWPEISNIQGNRFALIGDIWLATGVLGIVDGFLGILLFFQVKDWLATRHKQR